MSSYYHRISSDASLDTHPHNHGGDFTIEFYEQLYFPGKWEVALAEMAYYGQMFPNILHEQGEISILYDAVKHKSIEFVVQYRDQDL